MQARIVQSSSDSDVYTSELQRLKLELVTDTNSNCCLASVVTSCVTNHAWVLHVFSTQVRHECVQVSTLRQPVVCTQVVLSQLALTVQAIESGCCVINSSQQLQRWSQRVSCTDFPHVSLARVCQGCCGCAICCCQSDRSRQGCQVCSRVQVLLDARPVTVDACWAELIAGDQVEHLNCCAACVCSNSVHTSCSRSRRNQADARRSRAGFGLVVVGTQTQWAVVVLSAQTERLASRSLASCFAETVDHVTSEATQAVGGVGDRVVGTCTLQTVQARTRVRNNATEIVHRCVGADGISEVSLTTQQNSTEATVQTDNRFTTEQVRTSNSVGTLQAAVVIGEASFQLEHCIQTAAQIFNALETDTGTLDVAGVHCKLAASVSAASWSLSLACVCNAGIDDTVDSNGALCLCSTCKRAENGQCKQRFFHLTSFYKNSLEDPYI